MSTHFDPDYLRPELSALDIIRSQLVQENHSLQQAPLTKEDLRKLIGCKTLNHRRANSGVSSNDECDSFTSYTAPNNHSFVLSLFGNLREVKKPEDSTSPTPHDNLSPSINKESKRKVKQKKGQQTFCKRSKTFKKSLTKFVGNHRGFIRYVIESDKNRSSVGYYNGYDYIHYNEYYKKYYNEYYNDYFYSEYCNEYNFNDDWDFQYYDTIWTYEQHCAGHRPWA